MKANRDPFPFHRQHASTAPRPRFTYTPRKRPNVAARIARASVAMVASVAAVLFTIAR